MSHFKACNAGFLDLVFLSRSGDDAGGDRLWARLVIVMTSLSGDGHAQKQIPSLKDQNSNFIIFFIHHWSHAVGKSNELMCQSRIV